MFSAGFIINGNFKNIATTFMGKNDTEPLIFEQVSYLITQNKTQEPDYYEGINFYFNLFILSPFIAF